MTSLSLSIAHLLNNISKFFYVYELNISQFTRSNELLSDILIASILLFFDFLPFIIILKIQYWFIRFVKSNPGHVHGEINNFSDSSLSGFLDINLISLYLNSFIRSLCMILFLLSSSHNLITWLNVKLPSSLSSTSLSINSEYLIISLALT